MSIYRNVYVSLWDDPKVRELSKDGKLLFFYTFTNRAADVSGIYVIPPPSIMHDTGMTLGEVTAAIRECGETRGSDGKQDPLLYWDEARYVMWVVNMFKYQGRGEKNMRHAASHLCGLHNTPLIDAFIERYPEVSDFIVRHDGATLFAAGASYKGPAGKLPDGSPPATVQEVVELWNAIPGVKPCEHVGDTIRRRIAVAISRNPYKTWWYDYCKRIARSDFLCGRASPKAGSNPFQATLYWATGPINIDRTMAGDFDDKRIKTVSAAASWKGKT